MIRQTVQTPSLIIILMTALAPVIWGSTYIITTELLPTDRPFIAATLRCLPAGLILLLWCRWRYPQPTFSLRTAWRLTTLAALNIGIFQACLFIAAYRLPGGVAAVISAIQPLLILLLAWGLEQRRPAIISSIACVSAIAGMAVLMLSPDARWDHLGGLAAFTGASTMALGTYLGQRWRESLPLMSFTGWQLLLGGLMLLPAAVWIDPPLTELSLTAGAAYLYLCLFGALLAYALWFNGLSHLPPVAMASLGLLSPITAVALGWLLLDQYITGTGLVGLVTVLISILVVQLAPRTSKVHKNTYAPAKN